MSGAYPQQKPICITVINANFSLWHTSLWRQGLADVDQRPKRQMDSAKHITADAPQTKGGCSEPPPCFSVVLRETRQSSPHRPWPGIHCEWPGMHCARLDVSNSAAPRVDVISRRVVGPCDHLNALMFQSCNSRWSLGFIGVIL